MYHSANTQSRRLHLVSRDQLTCKQEEGSLSAATRAKAAHAQVINMLREVRPVMAKKIEESDAIDRHELNRKAQCLSEELLSLNRQCDQLLVQHISSSARAILEEKLQQASGRRYEITCELQKIKDQRDHPLFVRMDCASELIKSGLNSCAAEVLLDLICSGFFGLEQVISGEDDSVEFCLRHLSILHGLSWLNRLIESQPPEVASYIRLKQAIRESFKESSPCFGVPN
jgi:hypothetical protein